MPSAKNKPAFRWQHAGDLLLLVVGLCFAAYALFSLWNWQVATKGVAEPPDPHQVVAVSSANPDEKPVPSDATPVYPPDQPKKILIDAIGVDGFIQKVSQDQYGKIGAPENINFAGWFVNSVRPGDAGLSIIDGHVSGRYSPALFAGLNRLQKNDVVTVQFGDDSRQRFEVVEKRELPEAETASYLLKKHTGIERQLNLVTCGGPFDKKLDQYKNRVVVVTKHIED